MLEVTDTQFLVYYRRLIGAISISECKELPKFIPSLDLLRRQATSTLRTTCVLEVEFLMTRRQND